MSTPIFDGFTGVMKVMSGNAFPLLLFLSVFLHGSGLWLRIETAEPLEVDTTPYTKGFTNYTSVWVGHARFHLG